MRPAQALERLGVGREAGLRLLAGRQPDLVVEHRAQLRRRVHVELVPGQLLHVGLERRRRGRERVGDRLQLGPVDADAGHLHLGQDPHQRRLDLVVQHDHVLGLQAPAEAGGHGGDVGGLAGRLPGHVEGLGPGLRDVERELAGLLAQLLQAVLPRRGVEQVRRHGGVHLEPLQVDAERQQRPHGLLGVVAEDGPGQHDVELLDDRGRAEQVARHHDPEARLLALGRHQHQSHQLAAPGHARPARGQRQPALPQLVEGLRGRRGSRRQRHVAQLQRGPGGLVAACRGGGPRGRTFRGRRSGTARRGLPQRAGVEELFETLPDGPHLVALEGRLGRGAVPAAELDVLHVELEGHVAHERDDPGVRAGQLLARRQVLPQLGRELVQVREDAVEVAVGREELGRGLLPHARHARQVVRGVSPQGGQQHVLRGRDAGALRRCPPRRRARSRSRRACCRAPG